jgi:hypothetical protein
MNILLIEDMAGFAQPVKACLEAMGHGVTWIIGAKELKKNQVVGILASRRAQPMDDSWDGDASRLVTVELDDIEIALVDGGLIGPIKNGWDIVPTLVADGIVCVAISGGGCGNPQLEKSGALLSVPKEFVVRALEDGVLDLRNVLVRPATVARRLRAFTTGLRSQLLRARKRGRRIDLGFPILNELERNA